MDFVDSATGTGGHHAETDVGNQKTQAGVAEMKSGGTTTAAAQPQAGTQATATNAGAAPPLPARTGVTTESNGPVATGSSTGVASQ